MIKVSKQSEFIRTDNPYRFALKIFPVNSEPVTQWYDLEKASKDIWDRYYKLYPKSTNEK